MVFGFILVTMPKAIWWQPGRPKATWWPTFSALPLMSKCSIAIAGHLLEASPQEGHYGPLAGVRGQLQAAQALHLLAQTLGDNEGGTAGLGDHHAVEGRLVDQADVAILANREGQLRDTTVVVHIERGRFVHALLLGFDWWAVVPLPVRVFNPANQGGYLLGGYLYGQTKGPTQL